MKPHENISQSGWKLDEETIGDFVTRHGKTALYALFALFALIFSSYHFFKENPSQGLTDYMRLPTAIDNFSNSKEGPYEPIEQIFNRHPELLPAYGGEVAQIWLAKGESKNAIALISDQKIAVPDPYQKYTDTTFTIADGNLKDALNESLSLQANPEETPTLYLFNLLRIASLHDALGNQEEALSTWRTLVTIQGIPKGILDAFYSHAQRGNQTLKEYIESKAR